ncbi:MAG: hypothetical protein ACM34K_16890 [Bacillota bacterium]
MKRQRFTAFLFSAFFILSFSDICFSQNAGVNFMLGFPQGEFKQNVDRKGYGIAGHFMFWDVSPSIPFSLGINAGFMTYGNESRTEPFSMTIPDVKVNVDRTNNIVNFHLLLQVMPPLGAVRPYMEGLLGGAYLYTSTEIKSQGGALQDVASSTNFSDWAWSYGGGGGLMFKVFENDKIDTEPSNGEPKVSSVWIDLKARYLLGTQAEYLKEGSVKIQGTNVTYQSQKSKTDILTAHIGVVVYFH